MNITYVAVMSADGRITRGDDPNVHAWSSREDWHHFVQLRDQQDVVVIDRTTYETVKPEPEPGLLRVVLTNHPALYASKQQPDQLEFVTSTPRALAKQLAARGKQRVLLAGGDAMSHDFFKAGLVDDVYISIEPLLFAAGKPMLASRQPLDTRLQLVDITHLNDAGTLLLHYTVVH
jgi:dihydrofolate reductase